MRVISSFWKVELPSFMNTDPVSPLETEGSPSGTKRPVPVISPRTSDKHPSDTVAGDANPFAVRSQSIPGPLPHDVQNRLHTPEYFVEVLPDITTLESERQSWDDLAEHSVEPNVFYSPDLLLPALENLRPAGQWKFVVIKSRDRGAPNRPPEWCGFFPLVEKRRLRGVPVRNLQFLKHDFCFLRTPLIRQEGAAEILSLFVDWLLHESNVSVIDLAEQSGDGSYHVLLADEFHRRGMRPWITGVYGRAFMRRAESDDAFLRASISSGKLKDLRRLERRLGEDGPLRFESLTPDGDLEGALEKFLKLENSGWKKTTGTAIDCSDDDRAFFKTACRSLFQRGRLRLHFLWAGDTLVAAKCNFLATPGSFAFKIAFLEDKARFSPGVQLEIDNVRRFHAEPDLQWMDSCADPDHPMIDHLWQDKRMIQSWVLPLSRWGGHVCASLPMLSWLKRAIVRRS